MGVEQLDQLGEVRERAGQAVDLVDHDNIDPAVPDVRQQPLQGGAGSRAAIANIHQSCSDSHAIANPMDGVFGTDSGPHRAHAATS